MATQKQFILTPVGRLVAGSLYKGQTTDAEGRQLLVKNGPQAGQPRVDWFFAIAIPKQGEQHWAQTPWGRTIWEVGHGAFPNGQAQSPQFAWKIVDGDSQIPNSKGQKPCDKEGYRGHWVLHWSSGFAPKIFNADGTQQITQPDAVKLGYYIQVHGSVDGNGSSQKPGVYLNHSMVALAAYGPEIQVGPDAAAVGFGQGVALPPGASATPPAGSFNPAPPMAAPQVPGAPTGMPQLPTFPGAASGAGQPTGLPGIPSVPGMPSATGAAAMPPQLPMPQVPVQPHPGFLNVPGQPAAPSALPVNPVPSVPMVPAAPVRQMTAKANGATYEQMVASGWTDDLLRQHGMMV
jgi:hypothetical protein